MIMKVSEWKEKANHIYHVYLAMLEESGYGEVSLHFSDSHNVWEDGNYETWAIEWCIEKIDNKYENWYTDIELVLIRSSLKDLLALPKYEDCVDYAEIEEQFN